MLMHRVEKISKSEIIKDVKTRHDLPSLLYPNSIGVEVGVCRGVFSIILLKSQKFKRLYSVDNWGNLASSAHKRNYLVSVIDLAEHRNMSTILKMPSIEAATYFQDHTLDFVYIDAAHDYKNVCQDIEAWWPKVRPGSLFSGHDYFDRCPGVIRAVNEFVASQNLMLYTTKDTWASWYFIK